MTKHIKVLNELNRAMSFKNKRDREAILNYLSPKECVYKTLQQFARNIENLGLTPEQSHKLYRHQKTINTLRKGVKSKKRRSLLVQQTGGFAPWLIPLAVSLVPTVIDLFK